MKYKVIQPIFYYDTIIAKEGEIIEIDNSIIKIFNKNLSISLPKDYIIKIKKSMVESINNEDKVNSPSHYTWLKEKCGIEVIDIIRHLNFCIGNAIKYLLRAGHKTENGYSNKQKHIEDLKKAIWYINDEIKQLENGKTDNT